MSAWITYLLIALCCFCINCYIKVYINVLSINHALLDHLSLIMCLNEISNTRLHSISRGYKTVGKRHFFELTEQYFDREYFLKTVLHD